MKYVFIKIEKRQFCHGKPRRYHLNQMIKINIKNIGRNKMQWEEDLIISVIFLMKFHNMILCMKNVRETQVEGLFIECLKVNESFEKLQN